MRAQLPLDTVGPRREELSGRDVFQVDREPAALGMLKVERQLQTHGSSQQAAPKVS